MEARVHQTVLSIPYIRRDQEDIIRTYLRRKRPVLVIGSSMVGKTKMAARVIKEEFGSWPVAIPDSKTALANLDAVDVYPNGSVIWLDDIDRLIGAGGITDGVLRRLAAAENIVIGTIRARAYDQFRPSDQLRPQEWDVLCVFERVFISRDLTQNEQAQLTQTISDSDIRDRIRSVGLGEYVGAATQVAEALRLGAAGTNPLGYALVLAAANWRRCGINRPIPSSMLAALAAPHMDERSQAQLADKDVFNAGMEWATREINPNVALVQPTGTDSYSVYDYALDLISAQGVPIPESAWTMIVANAEISELLKVGYNAEVTYSQSKIAAEAWRKAASSEHANVAPRAMFNLGKLLAGQGAVQGAKDAYQKAIDSRHADAAPDGMTSLGILLAAEGDVEGAKDAYQKAITSGHANAAPRAMYNLGLLLADRGDVEGAKDAYQKAIDSADVDMAPSAAVNLGWLLADQGDVQGAQAAYQKAIDSGHDDMAPRAMLNLGVLLAGQGDLQGAMDAYHGAMGSRHATNAPMAMFNLGLLLARQRDVAGAKDAYQAAIDSRHTDMAPRAAFNLGLLLDLYEDVGGARDAYQKAIDSGHADITPMSAGSLGRMLARQGDAEGARDAYQKAIDSGHTGSGVDLGQLLARQGDVEGAKGAYQKVIDSGDTAYASMAMYNLGRLLAGQRDVEGARGAYQKAIDSGDSVYASLAATSLRLFLSREAHMQGAERPMESPSSMKNDLA